MNCNAYDPSTDTICWRSCERVGCPIMHMTTDLNIVLSRLIHHDKHGKNISLFIDSNVERIEKLAVYSPEIRSALIKVQQLITCDDAPDCGAPDTGELFLADKYDQYAGEAGPHCAQVTTSLIRSHHSSDDLIIRPLAEIPLFITDKSKQLPYIERPDSERSTLHWGQLKLFMSELWFMMKYTKGAKSLVYAGAAPGNHIPFLAGLFPHIQFILYDPAPFCKGLTGGRSKNVRCYNELFTENSVKKYMIKGNSSSSSMLFICDIRTGPFEKFVKDDINRQAN